MAAAVALAVAAAVVAAVALDKQLGSDFMLVELNVPYRLSHVDDEDMMIMTMGMATAMIDMRSCLQGDVLLF